VPWLFPRGFRHYCGPNGLAQAFSGGHVESLRDFALDSTGTLVPDVSGSIADLSHTFPHFHVSAGNGRIKPARCSGVPSQAAQCSGASITGMRLWIGAFTSFGLQVMIVNDRKYICCSGSAPVCLTHWECVKFFP
jgi:hypothetical protein